MSDTPAAADWWQASDGKWYPPEQHPDYRAPESPWGSPPQSSPSTPSAGSYGAPPAGYGAPPAGYGPPPAGYGQPPGYGQTTPYGQPQYSQTYGQYGYTTGPQTSSKATVALVLSIVSFVVCPVIPAVAALIFASQATKEIRESNGRYTGQGMVTASRIIAIANLVLSALAIAGIAALVAIAPVDEIEQVADNAQDAFVQSELESALSAAEVYYADSGEYPDEPFELTQIDSSVAVQAGVQPTGSGVVVIDGTSESITMGSRSGSGECFYIKSTPTETSYARDASCGSFASQLFMGSW